MRIVTRMIAICLFWSIAASGVAQTIQTIAGTGEAGYTGDNTPAIFTKIHYPYGMALDTKGNLYIADSGNFRIRKIDREGIISTIAGIGEYGFSGDEKKATSAKFATVCDVTIGENGEIYFADTYNQRIRKIDLKGNISTVAGSGYPYYSGDGGSAMEAELDHPHGIALDPAGNLYIADTYNHRIRKVDKKGRISTVIGNGSPGYSGDGYSALMAQIYYPYGITLDKEGNIYIADTHNYRIRKVDKKGIITTIAGTGERGFSGDYQLATKASLGKVYKLNFDSQGNLYLADVSNHRIRKIDTRGIIYTVVGNGEYGYSGDGAPATTAKISQPYDVVVDKQSNIYFTDSFNHRVRKITPHSFGRCTSFTAKKHKNFIMLKWEIVAGKNNAGFYLWRSKAKNGEYIKVSNLITTKFFYRDFRIEKNNIYYYKLEDISRTGQHIFHGPISISTIE